jgi:hypothetical protein
MTIYLNIGITIADLENDEFNLEDCFSFIQLQIIDAESDNDVKEIENLYLIQYLYIYPFVSLFQF